MKKHLFDHYSKPLLIVPCSAEKAKGRLFAYEKYIGRGYWGVLNSVGIKKIMAATDLLVISAKYGLISAETIIDDYECKLTKSKVFELSNNSVQIGRMRDWLAKRNEQPVYVACPALYASLVEKLGGKRLLNMEVNSFPAGGGIGVQRQYLKQWCETLINQYEKGIEREKISLFTTYEYSPDGDPPAMIDVAVDEYAYYKEIGATSITGPLRITKICEPFNGVQRIWFEGKEDPVSAYELNRALIERYRLGGFT